MSKNKKKKIPGSPGIVIPGEPMDSNAPNQTDVNNPNYKAKVKGTNTNNNCK